MSAFYENIGGIVGGIIVIVYPKLEKWYKQRQKPKQMLARNKKDDNINIILEKLRDTLAAERVYILDYHNGKESLTGACYNFVSMIYEKTNGVSGFINIFKDFSTTQFSSLIKRLTEDRHVYVPGDEDSEIGSLHRTYGIGAAHKFIIGRLIEKGSLSLTFNTTHRTLSEWELKVIKDAIVAIKTLRN